MNLWSFELKVKEAAMTEGHFALQIRGIRGRDGCGGKKLSRLERLITSKIEAYEGQIKDFGK